MDVIAIDHVVTTGGNCTAQGPCWYLNICPTEKALGVHAVCYEADYKMHDHPAVCHEAQMDKRVTILNPWDSQGNQITDGTGIYPCIRGCGGGGYQQGYVLQHIDEKAMFCDLYNFSVTGDVAPNLNASSCNSPTHSGPSLLIAKEEKAMGFDAYNMASTGDVSKTLNSIRSDSDYVPVVCMSERQISMMVTEDVSNSILQSDHKGSQVVCYALEGNVVDRVSSKNGKGWCEDVSPTLNTQDKHAVCYALEGNGARPSHKGCGWNEEGKMFTLNTIDRHSVCYGIDQQGGKSNCGYAENVMPALCSDSHGTPHAVCYQNTGQGYWSSQDIAETLRTTPASQYENLCCFDARGNGDGKTVGTLTGDHQNRITDYTAIIIDHSRRHAYQQLDTVPTLEARMGTGGGNVPLILTEKDGNK